MKIQRVLERNGFIGNPVKGFPSSIIPNGVSTTYTKGDLVAIIGLGEKGLPPTLLYPKAIKKTIFNDCVRYSVVRDAEMIGWIEKATDEQIMQFICDDSKPIITVNIELNGKSDTKH